MTRLSFNSTDESVKITAAPLNYSRTGYGRKIPTQYIVKVFGRWRRVYCRIYSNSGSCYIKTKYGEYFVDID